MNQDEQGKNDLRNVETVEKELSKQKKDATFCLSIYLAATSVWIILVALWEKLGRPIKPSEMTYGVELIAVIMFVVTQIKTRLKVRDLGLNFKNLKQTFCRALIICAVIIVLMFAAKFILKPGTPLFNWKRFNPKYLLTSIFQEFLARGFLLNSLIEIFDHKIEKHTSVLLSSLLFTTLHLYYGFMFMLGAGVLSVLLGYVFLKDKNIWGVSLIHFVFGMTGMVLSLV